MLQYVLECMGFQLLFLIIYDVFLKKETFFQWNRAYLLSTFLGSMILPFVKIDEFFTNVATPLVAYPKLVLHRTNDTITVAMPQQNGFDLPWGIMLLFLGMFLASLIFAKKMYHIHQLKNKNTVEYIDNYKQFTLSDSEIAFSFFRSIFIGDKISTQNRKTIIDHELIHVRQGHSYDLLFFELMRITTWFNPLVYVYQNRISEVHEYIADAAVGKNHKKEQYQLLLTQVFQTQNISFINSFYKSSLIKKRIVMLQKSESNRLSKLKFLMLMPLLVSMVFYTSAQTQNIQYKPFVALDEMVVVSYLDEAINEESKSFPTTISEPILSESQGEFDSFPVFSNCESNGNTEACFRASFMKHISQVFQYPEDAKTEKVQGKVYLIFTISEKGVVEKIVKRGPNASLENEGVRMIAELPKMKTPAMKNGNAIAVEFSVPINFRLQ